MLLKHFLLQLNGKYISLKMLPSVWTRSLHYLEEGLSLDHKLRASCLLVLFLDGSELFHLLVILVISRIRQSILEPYRSVKWTSMIFGQITCAISGQVPLHLVELWD